MKRGVTGEGAIISGIQQIGVGVTDMQEAWAWYRLMFGMDIPIVNDAGTAGHMTRYTGGTAHSRVAVLAANLAGGGAFEVWQYTSRQPTVQPKPVSLGDLGICAAVMKTDDIEHTFKLHAGAGASISAAIDRDPSGRRCYFVRDPYGNLFQVVESLDRFARTRHVCGGVCGAIVGVSDIEAAKKFYAEVLDYNRLVYEQTSMFEDLAPVPGGKGRFHRARLKLGAPGRGSFGRLLGESSIELVQAVGEQRERIFKERLWGDPGFIHLCFDVKGMNDLKTRCERSGHPFTVDSGNGFEMGEAAGRFAYVEDPDATLIEFVETTRMMLVKKLGLSLPIARMHPERPLPDWMLKGLRLMRVRDGAQRPSA